jgi:hypothetical protein
MKQSNCELLHLMTIFLLVQCVTSAFGDRPRRMLKVIQRFGKHFSCHLQGECAEAGGGGVGGMGFDVLAGGGG